MGRSERPAGGSRRVRSDQAVNNLAPKREIGLILGGARSGKSHFAEQLALEHGGDAVVFLATAEAMDDEMRERIARHRAARPAAWRTVEAPRDPASALKELHELPRVVVLDCLTLWLTNELLTSEPLTGELL